MNQEEELKIEYGSPWKSFSELPRPEGQALTVAALLYLVASAALSLSWFYVWAAVAAWGVLAVGCFYLNRHAISGAVAALVFSLLAFVLSGLAPAYGAVAAAICIGVYAGSFLQTCTRRFWLIVLLSAIGFGIGYAALGNWQVALCSLAPLPAVLLLSVATNMGEYRTTAICYATVGLLLSLIGGLLLWSWFANGSVALGVWRGLLQSAEEQLLQMQIDFRDAYAAQIREALSLTPSAEQLASADALLEQLMTVMSDENLRATAQTVIGLLPAGLGLACMIPAFLAQKLLNGAYASNGMRCVLTPECEFFTMSLPAAVLFILSSLFSLAIPVQSVFATVASNLCLLLFPGFFLLGARALRNRFVRTPRGMRTTLLLMAVALLCCSTVSAFLLAALFGAYERVLAAFRRRIMKKFGTQDRPGGGNDSL